jgi:hypothetical protein
MGWIRVCHRPGVPPAKANITYPRSVVLRIPVQHQYEIRPAQRLILQRFRGKPSLADVLAATRRLWADPLYSKSYDGIADFSGASVGLSMDDLRALISFLRQHDQTTVGRWGVVASSPLATACAMIYRRALAPRHEFEVFSSWDAACDFLGVALPPLEA